MATQLCSYHGCHSPQFSGMGVHLAVGSSFGIVGLSCAFSKEGHGGML